MKVFTKLEEIKNIQPTVIALGNFDGIHKGHQELIRRTVKSARIAGLKSAVFTFTNHPKNVLSGTSLIKNILYFEDKVRILKTLGVNYLFSIDFDEHIQCLNPNEFIEKLLVNTFRMKEAYCGFNHRFGYKAEGNPEILMQQGLKYDYGIHVLEPYKVNGNVVSSTLIRNLIAVGDVETCMLYMGRYYSVGGTVVIGNRIGRTIGFPTSNITIDETMVTPANGVYVTNCTYNGICYHSITNVGLKPTIGLEKRNIETHMFDFNKEIYGKEIRVEFLKKIRNEHKFKDVKSLSEQIQKDCLSARQFHEKMQ
ncbi:bifunctional riboflavin kinase/FAD synthetase [Sinanaerobacter sp. ZZT-01]|uniref:bifunctional riboflavin kinase/FAD synthetase n=1 Tax=Sinanaerobacter sp. ZZT-01 TaxID=3111540 RepID=UPI002D78D5E4|nr:bifunctional riboflavin kinase/FAD synthetase [Sinanaerobacter sp. ZZT-01]WRR93223.1 bifunctional riboflavin kinase/FAD synthetase [Sinanaerobacter sp. ZZT-01]